MVTLGMEEEVQVVDRMGQLAPHDLKLGLEDVRSCEGALDKEIHRCVIELKTRVCHNVDEMVSALANLRGTALRKAAMQDQQLIIAGLHPTAQWQQQQMHEGPDYPHYHRLLDEYGDIARGAMSFGMHMHFGFTDEAPKIQIMNRLRHVLPEALALSASAPIFEGRDTGLQSWRHSLLDRYPRMGTPDIWRDEHELDAHLGRLRRMGCIGESQGLWQDLRLHGTYGTLEVRIMDTHPDLDRIGLIATLLKWEVETLELELRTGTEGPIWSSPCIDENRWRARRHGLRAQWIDWTREEVCDTQRHFARWWSRIADRAQSLRERDYWERRLADALDQGTFADSLRQRAARQGSWFSTLQWMASLVYAQAELPQLAGAA